MVKITVYIIIHSTSLYSNYLIQLYFNLLHSFITHHSLSYSSSFTLHTTAPYETMSIFLCLNWHFFISTCSCFTTEKSSLLLSFLPSFKQTICNTNLLKPELYYHKRNFQWMDIIMIWHFAVLQVGVICRIVAALQVLRPAVHSAVTQRTAKHLLS